MILVILLLSCLPLTLSESPCKLYRDSQYEGLVAECGHRNLSSVPVDLPPSIVALSLVDNVITSLPDNVFAGYRLLKNLDLSENAISSFENGTFNNLSNLVTLWLQRNSFRFDADSLPSDVFKPLKHLQSLDLHFHGPNSDQDKYPEDVFRCLHELETLAIDTWPHAAHRGSFKYLYNLHGLRIIGNSNANLGNITDITFEVLKEMPLLSLELSCYTSTIDTGAFIHFPRLKNLTLATTYESTVSLSNFTTCLHPFVGKYMTLLDLTDLQKLRDSRRVDHELTAATMKYLLGICLEQLILRNNRISTVDAGIISSVLFRCVKYLDLSRNHISGEKAVFFELQLMTSLISLDVSYNRNRLQHGNILRTFDFSFNYSCPPNLKELIMHSGATLAISKMNITLNRCTHLQTIDISDCGTLGLTGRLTGISGLKSLDISGDVIFGSFFESGDFLSSLETLNMSGSVPLFDVFSYNAFFDMTQLQSLDLSLLNLQFITTDYITKLRKLKILGLRGNKFDTIPKEITDLVSLARLDMSSNSLRTLDQGTRDRLEKHLHDVGHFELLLGGNIFMCSCNTLDFISWLVETKIVLDGNRAYSCLTDSGEMTNTQTFFKDFLHQWRKCIGPSIFMSSVIIFFLTIVILTAAFICQKYYPVLEHNILNWLGYQVQEQPKRSDFKFDAYICYGSSDYEWPCHQLVNQLYRINQKLRLFVPDRDELPGDVRAESIINAVSASWKVVVVASENSFQDEWYLYSLFTAVRLLSATNCITGRIVLVYREDSPELRAAVPRFLLNVLQEDHILTAPDTWEEWCHLHRLLIEDVFI